MKWRQCYPLKENLTNKTQQQKIATKIRDGGGIATTNRLTI